MSNTSRPVLILGYNRPDKIKFLIKKLSKLRIKKIYISLDGPKNNFHDILKNNEIKKYLTKFKNCKSIKFNFLPKNLGCKKAVKMGIDWFFSYEAAGIILEDDCLPTEEFFRYCDVMLDKFKDNNKIYAISGNNFINSHHLKNQSGNFYYSIYPNFWGWATWAKSWSSYDINLKNWKKKNYKNKIKKKLNSFFGFFYWEYIFDLLIKNKIDTWDYQCFFEVWSKDLFVIKPFTNLVFNSGMKSNYTHEHSSVFQKFSKTNKIKKNINWLYDYKNVKYDYNLDNIYENQILNYKFYFFKIIFYRVLRRIRKLSKRF